MSDPPPREPQVTRMRAWAGVAGRGAPVGAPRAGVLTDFPPQMDRNGVVGGAVHAGDDRANGLDRLLEALPGGRRSLSAPAAGPARTGVLR